MAYLVALGGCDWGGGCEQPPTVAVHEFNHDLRGRYCRRHGQRVKRELDVAETFLGQASRAQEFAKDRLRPRGQG